VRDSLRWCASVTWSETESFSNLRETANINKYLDESSFKNKQQRMDTIYSVCLVI